MVDQQLAPSRLTVGFLTFGDNNVGMGHLYRCRALAMGIAAQAPGSDMTFCVEGDGAAILAEIPEANVSVVTAWDAGGVIWDAIIVDRLNAAPSQIALLKQDCRCLVSLDDTGDGRLGADIAVNALYPPPMTAPMTAPLNQRRLALDGPAYLAIDHRFVNDSRTVGPGVEHLLVTQGGSDTYGVVPRLVALMVPWLAEHAAITLHVQTGPGFEAGAALNAVLKSLPGDIEERIEWHHGVDDLAAMFHGMDLAISAAGITAFELAASGVPLLLVTAEPKEIETAHRLDDTGMAINLGHFDRLIPAALNDVLNRAVEDQALRRRLSSKGRQVVDGRGVERIVDAIMQYLRPHAPERIEVGT